MTTYRQEVGVGPTGRVYVATSREDIPRQAQALARAWARWQKRQGAPSRGPGQPSLPGGPVSLHVRVPAATAAWIESQAVAKGMTVSEVVRGALERARGDVE